MLIAVENNKSIVLFSIIFDTLSFANEASEHRVVGVIARASIIDSRALTHDCMTNPARFPGDALTRLFNEIFTVSHTSLFLIQTVTVTQFRYISLCQLVFAAILWAKLLRHVCYFDVTQIPFVGRLMIMWTVSFLN